MSGAETQLPKKHILLNAFDMSCTYRCNRLDRFKYIAPRWQKEEREEKSPEQEETVDEDVLMVDPIACQSR